MKTKQQYAEMSDFTLNMEVAMKLGFEAYISSFGIAYWRSEDSWFCFNGPAEEFTPCSKWDQAGPIINKYRITLDFAPDVCFARDDDHCSTHENPLRAAMIVFLLMEVNK